MNDVNEGLRWLESISVRFRPKTNAIPESAHTFAHLFEAASPVERLTVLRTLSEKGSKKLLALSTYLAEVALNCHEVKWLRSAILMHIIEDFRTDWRENKIAFSELVYVALHINANLDQIVTELLPVASARAREYLNAFLSCDRELYTLSNFGVAVSLVDGKFRFGPA